MLVALSMRISEAENYIELRDSISHDWISRLDSWGFTAVPIPNGGDSITLLKELKPSLLILTGGEDLGVFPERDANENKLLGVAMESGTPVLGVCRGLQLINQAFGGHLNSIEGHIAVDHEVQISECWVSYYGARTTVNSYHGACISAAGLASDLECAVVDADGNVEGAFLPAKPVAGIMWHPERRGAPDADRKMISDLVARGIRRG